MSANTHDSRRVDFEVLAEFRYQLRLFLRASEDAARNVGLQPQQHQLLLAVKGASTPNATIRYLSERLAIRHNSVVELVDRLEERGFVRRRPGADDRRVVCVELTPAGESVLRALSLHHIEMLASARGLVRALDAVMSHAGRVTRGRPRAPRRRAPSAS